MVRGGKGLKDRAALLPTSARVDLKRQIANARSQHERDLAAGAGWVELPFARYARGVERVLGDQLAGKSRESGKRVSVLHPTDSFGRLNVRGRRQRARIIERR